MARSEEALLDLIKRGRTDRVFELLEHAEADRLLWEGEFTPLDWFVYYGDVTAMKAEEPYRLYIVRLLLEHGADPNAKTKPGVETGAFMRDVRTRGETPLHRAAAFADETIIECLIEFGAEVEAKDHAGDSPLSWASYHLRPASVLALLTFGNHRISEKQKQRLTSDHGRGWGNGMDWSLKGDYLPESLPRR